MRRRFYAKLGLTIITLLALVLFNLDLARRGKSEEQISYEHWLSSFENSQRANQSDQYRLLEIRAQTSAGNAQSFDWKVSGVHSEYSKLERLLELLKEANTFTWGIPSGSEGVSTEEGHGISVQVTAANYSIKVFAPSGNISNNIAFQNFLKLLQIEAQRVASLPKKQE